MFQRVPSTWQRTWNSHGILRHHYPPQWSSPNRPIGATRQRPICLQSQWRLGGRSARRGLPGQPCCRIFPRGASTCSWIAPSSKVRSSRSCWNVPWAASSGPCTCTVAHCKEQDHGLWSVGCAFTSRLNKLELLALLQFSATLTSAACADPVAERPEAKRVRQPQQSGHPAEVDPFTAGSPSERRRTPRRGGDSVAVSIHRAGSSDRPIEGWVVNRSLGGLCVCSPKSFADDSILKIRPPRLGSSTNRRGAHPRLAGRRPALDDALPVHDPAIRRHDADVWLERA